MRHAWRQLRYFAFSFGCKHFSSAHCVARRPLVCSDFSPVIVFVPVIAIGRSPERHASARRSTGNSDVPVSARICDSAHGVRDECCRTVSVPPAYFPGHTAKKAQFRLERHASALGFDVAHDRALASDGGRVRNVAIRACGRRSHIRSPASAAALAVGFPRDIPAPDNAIPLADLRWQTLADGTRTARIELTSRGAVAIRVQIGLDHPPEALILRFTGSANAPR